MDVRTLAEGLRDELVALRRDLHQIPEVGLDLPQTQQRLLQALEGLPLEITLGRQLSSITAVLRGGRAPEQISERRVVLLRGDMDALPVVEETGHDWASTNGAMHACGHDLHMAGLVGAAKVLCAVREELPGDVVFMFQPGEEDCDGAALMIDEGVLDAAGKRADAAYGVHVWSSQIPQGVTSGRVGTNMAAMSTLDVTVVGRGGHGSAPHLALDPVPVVAEMITSMQVMLARHFNLFDPALITVGMVRAGEKRNIIPDTAHFEATVRAFSTEAMDRVFELLPPLLQGIAASHGVEVEIDFARGYPATINTAAEVDLLRGAVTDLFGDDAWQDMANPMTASEDFSRVLQQVPGAFVMVGAVPTGVDPASAPNNHSAKADYDDAVLPRQAAILAEVAVRSLAGEPEA